MSAKLRLHAVPATLVSLAVVLALAVAGVVTLSGAEAAGQGQPKCGDKITTDTTLHKDLLNCPNNGIVIGANGITLDLNGYLIDGDGTEFAACHAREHCDFGVFNDGHDGVTVMHGSVREFEAGAFAQSARHNRLLGISSSRNRFTGLGFGSCARSLIRNSSGSGSTLKEGSGMALFSSHHVRILHNSFRNNGEAGLRMSDSTRNLIKGNLSSRNKFAGIILAGSDRNQVRRNRSVRDSLIGIYLNPGSRNVIARNRVSHVRFARGGEGQAIEVDGGDRNVIARNSIRDPAADAISVGFELAVGNVVRRNRIRGAGEDGVEVDDKAKHTLLKRNHVFGAKDDGLDANSSTTKLTRNEARRNRDLGIEAVRGVVDGGGNI